MRCRRTDVYADAFELNPIATPQRVLCLRFIFLDIAPTKSAVVITSQEYLPSDVFDCLKTAVCRNANRPKELV